MRLIGDIQAEEDDIRQVADVEAGRFTVVATAQDEQLLQERLTARLKVRLAAGG